MAQTAVESIIKDLDNECKARGMFVNWDMYLAKEKEQTIEAAGRSCQSMCYNDKKSAEQYYNETYNNGL